MSTPPKNVTNATLMTAIQNVKSVVDAANANFLTIEAKLSNIEELITNQAKIKELKIKELLTEFNQAPKPKQKKPVTPQPSRQPTQQWQQGSGGKGPYEWIYREEDPQLWNTIDEKGGYTNLNGYRYWLGTQGRHRIFRRRQ